MGVDCGVASLPTGDYSVRGFTHVVALERKSLADLVQTLPEDVIDMSYFERLADEAIKAIDFFGPFATFVS